MKSNISVYKHTLALCLLFFFSGSLVATAGTLGVLTYTISGGLVTITDCDTAATGLVEVPATIEDKPVTAIGISAFRDCSSVTNIALPDSLISIGPVAFWACTSLTEITLPASVSSIGTGPFFQCNSLLSINVEAGNPYYSSIDGVLYDADQASLLACPGARQGAFTIPASVTHFGIGAFSGCSSLTNVVLPDGLVSITNGAFDGCISLTDMTIPAGVDSIGTSAFSGCSALLSATFLGDAPAVFGDNVFADTAADFTIFYRIASSGFTSPTWKGYPVLPLELTYEITGGTVTITGFDTNVAGSIEIPATIKGLPVTAIGQGAFESCSLLVDVALPSSITLIDDDAFRNCSSLLAINLPSGVTNIGVSAFQDCSALSGVLIPDSVTSIGDFAFEGCSSLTEILIPDGVSSIGASAFEGCSLFAAIVIPSSVTNLGDHAFSDCSGLVYVIFEGDAPAVSGIDLFSGTSGDFIIYYPVGGSGYDGPVWQAYTVSPWPFSYTISGGAVTITDCDTAITGIIIVPSTISGKPVKVIGNEAFRSCSTAKEIILPQGITTIGDYAFSGCSSLTNMTLPSGVKSMGQYAFHFCESLTEITVPAGVTSIEYQTFSNCHNLRSVTLPPNLQSIGSSAFFSCRSLTGITIPVTVNSIGVGAFSYCRNLEYIDVEDGNTYYSSVDGVLFNAAQTKLINYPPLKPVSVYALPDSVRTIGNGGFQFSRSLTSIYLPSGLTSIGYDGFGDCTALRSITIPASVSQISDRALANCPNLTAINLEEGNLDFVLVDGALLTADQTRLIMYPAQRPVTIYNVPATVTRIDRYAFKSCASLEQIILPTGLNRIEWGAFEDCVSLKSIALPDSVTYLEGACFDGCTALTNISLSTNLTEISYYMFRDCSSLTGFTVPAGVIMLGDMVFGGCDSLMYVDVDPANPSYVSVDGVLFNAAQTELINYPAGRTNATYTVPVSVTTLGRSAFQNSLSLTDIILPLGLTDISTYAFEGCSSLTGIMIPASVTNLPYEPFFDCDALEFVDVEAGNPFFMSADGVLYDNSQTELITYPAGRTNASFTLPAEVKAIRSNAFRNSDLLLSMSVDPGNSSFSSIDGVLFNADQTMLVNYPEGRAGAYTIPSGVTSLGDHAFYGCALLTDVTIPNGLAQIGAWAFERCTSLSEVVLPDTVAYLDGGAFARCSGLADITIPSNVYGINNYAFWECSALSAVRFLGDAPSIFGTDVFLGTDPDLLIQYSSTNSGFFSPVWMGSPATSWFVDNELDADVDLAQDLNGDGIDLLMAYALNLDPDLDLSGRLPPVEIDVDSMGMTFYAASPGVTYIVDTGEDLETWSTNSVSLTGLDMQYRRTATVDLTAPYRFLRLRVSK